MRLRSLFLTGFLAIALLAGTGCAAFLATSQDFYYHEEVFAPRRSAAEVSVLTAEASLSPYVVLGRVVATQGIFGTREAVMQELRRKAAMLGADALLDVRVESQAADGRSDAGEGQKQTRFAHSGNISTSEAWLPAPQGSIRLSISGLAVRYRASE